ncbi:MAG TPA: hypothetical protein VLK59_01450 [Solirubrobacteraceae bacterium]|jgi:hypothetical protein|nr:hypothetical protein [Solirubrobacteraceae bacterium]
MASRSRSRSGSTLDEFCTTVVQFSSFACHAASVAGTALRVTLRV